jgi:methylmalonyl-CoA/ethylmalonyl-CoA epimerase
MEVRSVHHVALAVEDLEQAVDTYSSLFGAEVELRGRIEDEGVEAVYLRIGGGRLELVSPLRPDTSVGRFLERRGPGLHHVAFEVADVGAAAEELSARGATVIEPGLRRGLGGHDVAFVHPESLQGVLAEVVSSHG